MRISLSFLEEEEGRWILWFPVALGLGIAVYFSWGQEPPWGCGLPVAIIAGFFAWIYRENLIRRRLGCAVFAFAFGFSLAQFQTLRQDTPMLNTKLGHVLLRGTIGHMEHLPFAEGLMYRLILEDPVALDSKPKPLPRRIRLTVRNSPTPLWTGQEIQLTAVLSPLTDPVSPGGYDFRRQAFFKGIGATGYSVTPPQILSKPPSTFWHTLDHLRHRLTRTFLQHMPSPTGSLAAALITGDKASVPKDTRQQFADAGLAHILAISGLHLSIVAGLFFLLIQGGLALVPALALRVPLHKISALLSLGGTGAYLILSGAGVPAQRAFIMTALVLVAVVSDRKAITLRLVAFAATLVLILSPEALLSPSFQLSFAAVVALVAAYESWSAQIYRGFNARHPWVRSIGLYVMGSLFSTVIATLATTPYTILTFHRFTLQGIVANLLAIPLTVFILMPCAVLTCFLMLFQDIPATLPFLSYGLRLLASLAHEVSLWPGAVISVPRPPWAAIPLVTGGALWLCLWKTKWRWGGVVPILGATAFLGVSPPPHIWVDGEGKVIGFEDRATNTLFVSSSKAGKFAVQNWLLESNIPFCANFPYTQTRKNWMCDAQSCLVHVDASTKVLMAQDAAQSPWCADATLVISLAPLRGACAQATVRIDRETMRLSGSQRISLTPQGLHVQTGRQGQGTRPWVRHPASWTKKKKKKGDPESYVKK